ncbi:MAG: hypothetical protein K6A23_01585 [Butyrivibrio sp.]|nr:hypothetical protein [Butyrivibrio sp.]
MSTSAIITLIVVVVVIAAIIGLLYFLGKRAQKKQDEQQAQIEAAKQSVTMLIIDKKKMKMKDAGLPQAVIEQTPKLLRRSKLPILKVRIGNQVMSLICADNIFDQVPVKKEVKASISGIYVTEVKALRGKAIVPEKKKSKFSNFISKLQEKAGAKPVK